jgi:nucleoside 2-deoxyribosyltransferase
MSRPVVYLAGPITGLSYDGAVGWREDAEAHLDAYGIGTADPMRGKSYLSGQDEIKDSYADHAMSTAHAIFKRDRMDCRKCDALLVNFLGAEKVSIGTVMEIAWADANGIPVVIVMEPDNLHQHSMVKEAAYVVADTLDEGIQITRRLLAPWVGR